MIDLEEGHLAVVRGILALHVPDCEVRVFGSRVRGTSKKFSDIDLALLGAGPVPDDVMTDLRYAFAESALPYRVDVVDWSAVSSEFRKAIEEQGFEVIQHG